MDALLVVVTMSIAIGVCFGYMFRRCIMAWWFATELADMIWWCGCLCGCCLRLVVGGALLV